ncbi:MAG: nucleotide pyrophosphohydrolase [Bacteroidales bacterium]|nr:nucleotide pyrophosphohydrolase [Bacteroidales bacterium]
MNMANEIKALMNDIDEFTRERDWDQFHDPKDLALALSIEASELLEAYLWKTSKEASIDKVKEELADVFNYAFLIASKYGFDVEEIVRDKMAKNAEKYPIEKSKGVATKYNEL